MPPHSRHINEEGAVFKSFYLVKNGVFQEEGIVVIYMFILSRASGRGLRKDALAPGHDETRAVNSLVRQ